MKRSPVAIVVSLILALAATACGSAIKRDAKRLRSKCDVIAGQPVTEDQAICVARLHGVRETRECPADVDRPEGFGTPAFRVLERCTGLGVVVAASSGRVLALVAGDEILHD